MAKPTVVITFDDTRKSVTGTTEAEVKNFRFSIHSAREKWSVMIVFATLWVTGGTGTLRVYVDAETTPRLSLSTTSTSETLVWGQMSIGDLADGVHTARIRLVNSTAGQTTYTELLEVYAK